MPTMNKSLILIAAATTGILTASCGKNDRRDMEMPTVDVAFPETDSITLTTSYPARLTASTSVDVVALANGRLLSQDYKNGEYVRKGRLLFRIEDGKYRDAVRQAEAALATAVSECQYAKSHYEAVKRALESDAVSKMEVIQAESDYHQAEASIKNAQAALETARTNLGYCTISAPISGYASAATHNVGNYVNGGDAAVVMTTIYDPSILTAHFSIENAQGSAAHLSDTTTLRNIPIEITDTAVAHQYFGDLSYVAPTLDTSTGTLNLRCKIKNDYGELRPGMFVKVNLPYGVLPKAILVKDAAIGTDQLGKYLYTVNDSDRVVYTPVKVGPLFRDSLRVVYDGISPESKYVTKAMLKVRDGIKVATRTVK